MVETLLSPAATLTFVGAATQPGSRLAKLRGTPPAGAAKTVPPLRSRVVRLAVLKPALIVTFDSTMSSVAVTRTDDVPVARFGPVAITATSPRAMPWSCALPLSVPAAISTVGVATPTIAGFPEITVISVPPLGAGCVRLIGSEAVRVYGTLSVSGTEMVLVLTVICDVLVA